MNYEKCILINMKVSFKFQALGLKLKTYSIEICLNFSFVNFVHGCMNDEKINNYVSFEFEALTSVTAPACPLVVRSTPPQHSPCQYVYYMHAQ